MHYWDTSTLAKLYVQEPDSGQFAAHLVGKGPITSSELAAWELVRVLARKEADGLISVGAAELIFAKFQADAAAGIVQLLSMDKAVQLRFEQLVLRLHRLNPPLFIRTSDAIHIATADFHGAQELITTDKNMRACAKTLGLKPFP